MKTKYLFLGILIFGASFKGKAQISQYVLDFSDPTTYQVTCGSVNSAQWTVNSGTCSLYTPILTPADTGKITADYTIRINQKGNMTADDKLYFQIKIGYNDWYTDTVLLGNVASNVRDITGSIELEHNDFVVFRFVGEIVSNGFWAIKNGDIVVNNVNRGNFLPVTLASFSGFEEDNQATLEWVTFSETNNDFFTIERSDDGNSFYSVGTVGGAGNSNQSLYYMFTDEKSLNGETTYYRLRQTDYDGTTDISNPIVIRTEASNDVNVWAYSENETVFIHYETQLADNVQMNVFELSGQMIDSKTISVGRGHNTIEWTSEKDMSSQMYLIQIVDSSSNSQVVKVIL
jgi:hypothetical protein